MSKILTNANQRSRTVSFRASQEEYELLRKISVSKGARSISEFTRSVACCKASDNGDLPDSAERNNMLANLTETVSSLDHNIQKLIRILESTDKQKGQ